MNSEPDPKLVAQIDAALKNLPTAQAPPSLIRHVLATIEARQAQPWWRSSWWHWPITAKAAFAILAVALAAVLSGGGFVLSENAVLYSKQWMSNWSVDGFHFASLDSLSNAGYLVWTQAMQPLLHYGLVAAGLLYLVCVGLGTACFRFAVKHA